jgi:tetratricopeptide (TPR) repeat protein
MSSHLQGYESAYWSAMVAYLVSRNLEEVDINYGLEVGIGNAVVCSLFALATLLTRMERYSDAVLSLEEMLPLLKGDGDLKGYLEALTHLGQAEFQIQRYADAARHFQQSLTTFNNFPNADNVLSERSSQDMVRIDNRNVFDFGVPSIVELADNQLISFLLNDYVASSLIQTQNYKEAVFYSSQAIAIWENKQLSPGYNPTVITKALYSYATALAATRDLKKAIQEGLICLNLAKSAGDQMSELGTVFLLAYCYQELGDRGSEAKYRKLAEALTGKQKSDAQR